MAAAAVSADPARALRAGRLLARTGLWGTALTVVILAASVLLRLSTAFDAQGASISRLPEAVETAARLGHRVAAMAVTVMALFAAMVAFGARPAPRGRVIAVVTILVLTVFLAVLGRYTPGYAVPAVTLGNVLGGMLLACAFWWLREERGDTPFARGPLLAAELAFAALVVQAGVGAVASALALRGSTIADPLHAVTGTAFLACTLVAAGMHRGRATAGLARGIALVALAQFAAGAILALAGTARPWPLAWLHAMVALGLAVALTSLVARSRPW